jgi:hypothetical protein
VKHPSDPDTAEPVTRDHEEQCDHGVTFDEDAAHKMFKGWIAKSDVEFIAGNPASRNIRRLWPRLDGKCPKGCGYVGISYASEAHYIYGDW